ncbi:hypothetical protein IJF81_05865 [bacterium]|nr:hypothetical protein [bacterium]
MHKLGLKLWSINTDFYLAEAVRLYNKGVYDYIELYVVPETLNTLEKWKKLKIPFIIHNAHFAQGFNLAKKEKEERNLEIYSQTKQFADELDAKYIIFHGGIDGDIKETARQLANLNEPRALIENKPFVALPNRMGGNFCRGYNSGEIKLVQDATGCGFCLDFGHAICAANSLKRDVFKHISDFFELNPQMFHLTDVNDITSIYDSHPHLNEGELDLKQIISLIPDEKYVTLETNKNSKENLDDFIVDCDIFRQNVFS